MSSGRFKIGCYHEDTCCGRARMVIINDHSSQNSTSPKILTAIRLTELKIIRDNLKDLPGRPTGICAHGIRDEAVISAIQGKSVIPSKTSPRRIPNYCKVFGNKVDKGVLVRIHMKHLTDSSHHKINRRYRLLYTRMIEGPVGKRTPCSEYCTDRTSDGNQLDVTEF